MLDEKDIKMGEKLNIVKVEELEETATLTIRDAKYLNQRQLNDITVWLRREADKLETENILYEDIYVSHHFITTKET